MMAEGDNKSVNMLVSIYGDSLLLLVVTVVVAANG